MWKTFGLVSCLAVASCTCTSGPAPVSETPPPPQPTSAPTPPPADTTPPPPPQGGPDASIEGAWKSASCGARKYERRMTLRADGTFSAEDLVSPCPPKVACVWSGIVDRQGTWSKSGAAITFAVTGDPGSKPGAADFPLQMAVDSATGAPTETQDGAHCVYSR